MSDVGAVTAEYVVGTLAATAVAATLVQICSDGWLLDQFWGIIREALRPGVLLEVFERMTGW